MYEKAVTDIRQIATSVGTVLEGSNFTAYNTDR